VISFLLHKKNRRAEMRGDFLFIHSRFLKLPNDEYGNEKSKEEFIKNRLNRERRP